MGDAISWSLSCPMASNHGPFPPVQQMQSPDAASFEDKVSVRILQCGCPFQAPVQPWASSLSSWKFLSSSYFCVTARPSSSPLPLLLSLCLPEEVAPSSSQPWALPCSGSTFLGSLLCNSPGPKLLPSPLKSCQGIPQMHSGRPKNATDAPGGKGSGIEILGKSFIPDALIRN